MVVVDYAVRAETYGRLGADPRRQLPDGECITAPRRSLPRVQRRVAARTVTVPDATSASCMPSARGVSPA
ncbi:MAG: hypothetical protein DIU80_009850 [Chloroflexota bacterium]|nr:MAG: hypothetical protein DIU80_20260 [Chloroflexota bacterium]